MTIVTSYCCVMTIIDQETPWPAEPEKSRNYILKWNFWPRHFLKVIKTHRCLGLKTLRFFRVTSSPSEENYFQRQIESGWDLQDFSTRLIAGRRWAISVINSLILMTSKVASTGKMKHRSERKQHGTVYGMQASVKRCG